MSITKDDIQFCICRFIKFSINSGWNTAKNRPFISCTLLFFSFLYACFPWFFWGLIHLLAFLILVGSITRIYLSTSQSKKAPANNSNADSNAKQNALNVRNNRPIVRARSVRQRKSRETSRNNSLQNSEDEKSTVKNNKVDKSSEEEKTTVTNNTVDDKSPLLEENAKEIQEVKVEECSTSNDKPNPEESRKFVSGCEIIESESSEEDEREREENNKAVQWTADDEKNLMDLGFSEMERNKRLESLIARRRARKMMSLQIRRTPSRENVIAPIAIPNNKPFFSHHITDQFSTPMPGSAPSVLLPGKDPFDIPYDPQEEKPDLTGGSFDQEFIAPDPKDAVFSRHDSFTLRGGHHPWPQISFTNNHRARDSLDNPDADNEDTDKIIEIESCQSPESDSNKINADCIIEEVHEENHNTDIETVVHDQNYKYSSTSSEEDKEGISNSLTSLHPTNGSMNRDSGGSRMEYILHNSFSSSSHHQPANSIESDLQVEVSEVSSPPRSNSSLDIGSSIEEEDVTSGITFGNEATWETSSRQPRNDDDVEEIYKLHEENQMNPGFSRSEEYKDILVPHEMAKNINDDVSDSLLRSSGSKDELLNGSQERVSGSQMEVKENSHKPSPESSQASPSGISAFTVFENGEQSTEKQMPRHFQTLEVHSSNSSINEKDHEVDLLNMNGGTETAERTEISTSISPGLIERQQEEKENRPDKAESQNLQFDENDATEIPEDKRESEKQEEMDEPMPIEDKHTVESTEANEGGEHTTEDRISEANESFGHQAVELQPTPMLQEVPEVSSPISSPRSVLQPKLSMDHISNMMEDLHSEIQQLETQIVENNTPQVERGESTTSALPSNATVSRENSTSLSSLDGLEAKASQQESSHPSSSAQPTDSLQFTSMSAVAENEITQNETRDIPECTTEDSTSPVTLVDLQKPVEETNPSILDVINDNLVEHYIHEVSPAVSDPNEQLNESSQSVNTEESAHHSKSVTEINSPSSEPKSAIAEHEGRRDNTMEIPDSIPEKHREAETDPSTLNNTNDKSQEPHEEVPPPA